MIIRLGFRECIEAVRVCNELCYAFQGSNQFVDGKVFIPDPEFDEFADLWVVTVYLDAVDVTGADSVETRSDDIFPDDMVSRPSHYTQGNVECIDAIQSALSEQAFVGYLRGNAMKYLWRCMDKGNMVQDLNKAQWYINKILETLEG